MTYSSGGLIQATDYNGFVSTTSAANINATWNSTYGQTALGTVSTGGTVTAVQWDSVVNTIASMGNHQATTITSRTAPSAGDTIAVLSNVGTDIGNCYTNRYNAYAVGSQYTGWTGTSSKTTSTGSGASAWTITFTHTVTFANATSATNFFGAGGYIQFQFGKSSTGTVADTEWNAFIGAAGAGGVVAAKIIFTSDSSSKTIASNTWTGTNKTGGSGTPTTLAGSIGFNQLTPSSQTIYKQFDSGAAYSSNYVQITASYSAPAITFTTTWYDNGDSNVGSTAQISGGTALSGTTFGTAPAVLCTYYPPETTYLSNTWGTPTIAATVT
jgi:hypothetical protein